MEEKTSGINTNIRMERYKNMVEERKRTTHYSCLENDVKELRDINRKAFALLNKRIY